MPNEPVGHPGPQLSPRGIDVAAALRSLTEYLRERGHAVSTIAKYGRVADHFTRWLAGRDPTLSAVNERGVKRFLERHVPRCRCPQPGPGTRITVRAALHHFLRILRREGRVPPRVPDTRPAIMAEVAAYDTHLRDTCGLASATRIYRRRYVREFLHATFGSQAVQPRRLRPTDIERFITERARRCQSGSAQVLASSLRSWLRYQQLIGAIDARLIAAVPGIPRWRLASLPSGLDEADVDRLLNAIDRTTPSGRRDYAMARCVADLGLRACEVASLQLSDVDWRRGALRVPAGKVRRADWLPLPARLGRAIADYLRRGRPRTVERALFVHHHPPVGKPIGPHVVRLALQRVAIKAGIEDRWRGPHALRHTMATRLLRSGASLKEVADILRHRSLDTTAIYTKVDFQALDQVPLPWPGRTP